MLTDIEEASDTRSEMTNVRKLTQLSHMGSAQLSLMGGSKKLEPKLA